MFKNKYTVGLLLYAVTMAIFFIVHYALPSADYYSNALNSNAFVLPAIYTLGAFLCVHYGWKRSRLNFRQAFERSFVPMALGGLLSFITIFAYLNYADSDVKLVLNTQFVERNKRDLSEVYNKEKARLRTDAEKMQLEKDYRKSLQSFGEGQIRGKDMFTLRHFAVYFAGILIFYTVISFFLGAFFRTKSVK